MRALGIDLGNPGGLAVLTDEGGQGIWPLAVEEIKAGTTNIELQRIVHRVCKAHAVQVVATEKPGTWGRITVGMSQRGKQDLVRAVCQGLKIPLVDYQPQQIKKAVTDNGRASKEQVGRCVRMLVRIASTHEHVLDACAIALVALNRERVRLARASQRRLNLRRTPQKARRP